MARIHILELVLPARQIDRVADGPARSRSTARRPVERWRSAVLPRLRADCVRTVCLWRPPLVNGLFPGAEEIMSLSVGIPVFNEQEVAARAARAASEGPRSASQAVRTRSSSSTTAAPTLRGALLNRRRGATRAFASSQLSRNFGHQAALGAALDHATGDAVVLMDADLQDEPEIIPQFVAHHRAGADVVFARRRRARKAGCFGSLYRAFLSAHLLAVGCQAAARHGRFRSPWAAGGGGASAACPSTSAIFADCAPGSDSTRSAST